MTDTTGKHNDPPGQDKKAHSIVVNGTLHEVQGDVMSYAAIVEIAFPGHPNNPDILFAVTFDNARSKPHQGVLSEGGSVTIKNKGTIFDVTQTNRS